MRCQIPGGQACWSAMSYHIKSVPIFSTVENVPWLPCVREGGSFHILPALPPRMIGGRGVVRPGCRQSWFRGWGRGGRGSASSVAQRRSGGRELAKVQTLSAIANGDVSGLTLPHHHSTVGRRPVTILALELQQAIFVTHHPVFTEHSFLRCDRSHVGRDRSVGVRDCRGRGADQMNNTTVSDLYSALPIKKCNAMKLERPRPAGAEKLSRCVERLIETCRLRGIHGKLGPGHFNNLARLGDLQQNI